ncbi:MAG: right-handed parallel beta-helix repeat-containing protein [Ignavibacteria bacterium]|nr:right-handed parallel beta-helix repeat-containing protein [Ignavibacteria bacterium]
MKIFTCKKLNAIAFGELILMLLISLPVFSANYYVASNGNDGNNGLSSSSPWKTISKVNSSMSTFNPGDLILFRRGDKFYGEIKVSKSGTTTSNIIFGSYGSGALPEITGIKSITGWSVHSGNIYKATVSDTVSQVMISEKLMTIARYPNTGFLKIDAGNGNTGFYDAALNQSSGYFNGSVCKVRTINWIYEKKTVSSFSGGNVTFSTSSMNPILANYGYYFDNKLSLLDTEGEWFYDKAAGKLYLYAPGGVNPGTLNVEAVTKLNGIYLNINVASITIQDLKIKGFRESGVDGYTGNNFTVQRCNISRIERYGIRFNGIDNSIFDNVIEDVLNTAITGVFTQGEISGNFINRTGLVAGYGEDGYGYYGMLIWNAIGTIIEGNTIDSTGYGGISISTSAVVRKNNISYSLLTLNDGGGISVGTSDGLEISDNIISNSIGNTESSANPVSYASGIYVNESVLNNTVIQRNSIYACRFVGIIIDMKYPSSGNVIRNNLLYNNFAEQIRFSDWSSSVFVPSYNTIVKGNIFYCLQSTQICMSHIMFRNSSFSDFGNFDSNYFCNPYSEYVINKTMVYGTYSTNNYNLSYWKSNFNEDLNSKSSLVSFSQYGVTDTLSSNLVINSNFNNNVNNWTTYPSGSYISHVNNPLLDAGSMKIRWTGVGNNESFTMSNNMSITQGNYYLLSFSCAGDQNGTFSVWGMGAGIPFFPKFFPKNYFSYSNTRKEYSIVSKADTTDLTAARLSFDLILPDSLFYLDNVNYFRVNVSKIDSSLKSKLFVNETDISKMFSLNGIAYKDLDGNSVTGSITLPQYSSKILVNDNSDLYQTLNLTAYTQGLYDPVSNTTVQDTFRVYLRNNYAPYAVVDSAKSFIGVNGNSYFYFKKAQNGINYYLDIRHRNSIEIWSSNTVSFNDNAASYNISSSVSQAYGNNLVLEGSKYCIYSGDINKDNIIDVGDISIVDNDAFNSLSGYVLSDVNGDLITDVSDMSIVSNNVDLNIVRITP